VGPPGDEHAGDDPGGLLLTQTTATRRSSRRASTALTRTSAATRRNRAAARSVPLQLPEYTEQTLAHFRRNILLAQATHGSDRVRIWCR
jgi:hypothetical protein